MVIAQNDGPANVTVATTVTTSAEGHIVVTNTYMTSGSQTISDTVMPRLSVSQGLNPLAPPYNRNNTFTSPNNNAYQSEPSAYFPNLSAPGAPAGLTMPNNNFTRMPTQNYQWNMEPNNQQLWISRNLQGVPYVANSTQIDDGASIISSKHEEADELERRIQQLRMEAQQLEEQNARRREEMAHQQRIEERLEIMRQNYAANCIPKPGPTPVPAFPQGFSGPAGPTPYAPFPGRGDQQMAYQCPQQATHNVHFSEHPKFNQPYNQQILQVQEPQQQRSPSPKESLSSYSASGSRIQSDSVLQASKTMKQFGLKYSGSDKEFPEQFLSDLKEFLADTEFTVAEALGALKSVFTGPAAFWYKAERRKKSFKTYEEFKLAFVRRFIGKRSDEALFDELRARTQGKGESIAEFASKFCYIASNLQEQIAEDKLVRMAKHNLIPDYQKYMFNQRTTTFDELIELGQEFEQEREYIANYVAPLPKSKVKLPGAAFEAKSGTQSTKTSEVAAIDTSVPDKPVSGTKTVEAPTQENKKVEENTAGKRKRNRRGKRGKPDNSEVATEKVDAISATQVQLPKVQENSRQVQGRKQNTPSAAQQNTQFFQPQYNSQVGLPAFLQQPVMPPQYQYLTQPYIPQQNLATIYQAPNQAGGQQWNQPNKKQHGSITVQNSTTCVLCRQVGHRVKDCPSRNGQIYCYRCGAQGKMSPHCDSPACVAHREASGNEAAGVQRT